MGKLRKISKLITFAAATAATASLLRRRRRRWQRERAGAAMRGATGGDFHMDVDPVAEASSRDEPITYVSVEGIAPDAPINPPDDLISSVGGVPRNVP